MKAAFELAGEPRAQLGRTDSRRLRKAGKVPAIMYGGGEAPEALVLDHNALKHQMSREAFYTSILTLKIGSKAQQVVVKGVERHPARPLIMHLDFQRVREDVEITISVRIHFIGEAEAKGVKDQGGVVEHLLTDVEVRCLPRYLPEYLDARRHGARAESDLPPLGHQGCPKASRSSRSPAATITPSSRSTCRAPRKSTSRSRPRRRPAKCPRWRRPSPEPKAKPLPAMPSERDAKGGREARGKAEGKKKE